MGPPRWLLQRRRARPDDQQRRADRHQRHRTGVGVDTVDPEPAADDQREREDGRDVAQPVRDSQGRQPDREQAAGQRFPQTGDRVVVVVRLVDRQAAVRPVERGERDDQHRAADEEPDDPRVGERPGDAGTDLEQCGESEGDEQGQDEELALHRHRPDVLQRAVRRTRGEVVLGVLREIPVLVVQRARDDLAADIGPPGLREDQQGQHRDRDQDGEQRRQQPFEEPFEPWPRVERVSERDVRSLARDRVPQQRPDEEVSREGEEDVDAAGDLAEPHVKAGDEGDGDTAQAVEVGAVCGRCRRRGGRLRRHYSRRRCHRACSFRWGTDRSRGRDDRLAMYSSKL